MEPVIGSEQGGVRPVLIIQNDFSNKHSPVIIVAAITSRKFSKEFPTNVFIPKEESKLNKDSTVLFNQIRTIDKTRLIRKIGSLDNYFIGKADRAIKASLGLN